MIDELESTGMYYITPVVVSYYSPNPVARFRRCFGGEYAPRLLWSTPIYV
jgi:hypothetical protein